MSSLTLGELAVRLGLELRGDPDATVVRAAPLGAAEPGTLSFLAAPQYRALLATTRATAVVLGPGDAASCPVAALITRNPHVAFARALELLYPEPIPKAGVHPAACVAPEAVLGPGVGVAAGAVIGARARIGAGTRIGPGCVIGAGAEIGADGRLVARVCVGEGVRVGARAILHPGVVLGSDGFGFAREGAAWVKVPQVGGVVIGDDVEIGANTTIDRGALGDTVIEDGVKLDNQIQVGHNVRIGAHTAIAACTGVSGSTRIGRRCMIGGAVAIAGHIEIADDVVITGASSVTTSIRAAGMYSGTMPLEPARAWRRMVGRFKRLDAYVGRIRALERARGAAAMDDTEREDTDE